MDIAIVTALGNARNNINVLSSDLVIACGMGAGTASEVALALKANKKVILLNNVKESQSFFSTLCKDNVVTVDNPESAIEVAREIVNNTRKLSKG